MTTIKTDARTRRRKKLKAIKRGLRTPLQVGIFTYQMHSNLITAYARQILRILEETK